MIEDEVRAETRPSSGEAPFHLHEMFFSRTDERGIIHAGNEVFCRVAGYSWNELSGAPHKIIRHPDMPKGVFHMVWDALKNGEILGVYVKNLAKDGLFYWVYAVLVPCEGGFLSVRIKPSSEWLPEIEALYQEQLRLEREEQYEPKKSAEWLIAQLATKGFPDYIRFMSHQLSSELMARNTRLNRAEDKAIKRFRHMQTAAGQLTEQTDELIADFEMTEIIPHNMRVIASRLEPNGGPISTLSTNYGGMSREMSGWFETHVVGEQSNFSTIKGTVAQGMYKRCMARILSECALQLDAEPCKGGSPDLEHERKILVSLADHYSAQSEAAQNQVAEETHRILDACKKMNRHMLGLSTTRVMCKIEGARLTEGRESLTDIIGELNGFQQRIREKLNRIEELSGLIRTLLA